jgi:hypothetical protein
MKYGRIAFQKLARGSAYVSTFFPLARDEVGVEPLALDGRLVHGRRFVEHLGDDGLPRKAVR